MLWQPALPEAYHRMSPDALAAAIARARRALGDALVVLGHHYQADEVIRHADVTGDSLKLSQVAAGLAKERPVKYVVFCGVHFMAETADMLTPDEVAVLLPDLSAGCSMADMAQYDDALDAWERIHASLDEHAGIATGKPWRGRVVPITYVNSSAAIKAFVGAHGGACCTSSNAREVLAWAFAGGTHAAEPGEDIKVIFLPDQHLGRNTAHALGIDVARHSCLYDPKRTRAGDPLGGATPEALAAAKVILWAGHCSVHKLFRPEHCDQVRARADGTTILVHPECAKEVVDKADMNGSTEYIIRAIRGAAPGSRWAVGTEVHLVARLAREAAARGVHVSILSDCQCLCTTMYRIDEPHLLWTLDHLSGTSEGRLAAGREGRPTIVNQVRVHPEARAQALLAIDRMLELSRGLATAVTSPPAAARDTAAAPREPVPLRMVEAD